MTAEFDTFTSYEIRPVVEIHPPYEGSFCVAQASLAEAKRTAKDARVRAEIFWTLYGQIPDQGVVSICDRADKQDAVILYRQITGSNHPIDVTDETAEFNLPRG